MTSEQIREALDTWQGSDPIWEPLAVEAVIVEAAQAYADLLENGEEVEVLAVSDRLNRYEATQPILVTKPGRYLIVRVEESP